MRDTRRWFIRSLLLAILLTAFLGTSAIADEAADSVSLLSGYSVRGFSLGAGYEYYHSDWVGNLPHARGTLVQNRFFLKGDYRPGDRFRVGIRVGAADATASDMDGTPDRRDVHYGFRPFGSIILSGVPIGASPETPGLALEVLLEISVFASYPAQKVEGYIDGFGMGGGYEAYPELKNMWEGKAAAILAFTGGSAYFGVGPVLLKSGAEMSTPWETSWHDETIEDYFKPDGQAGALLIWRLPSGRSRLAGIDVLLVPPTFSFKVWMTGVLTR